MAEDFKKGDKVYLTPAAQDFLARNRGPSFNISVIGRMGVLIDIIDWVTDRGKHILRERKKSLTWSKLNSTDFKYIVLTFYPELVDPKSGNQGMAVPEILCLHHPMVSDREVPLFRKWPDDFLSVLSAATEEDSPLPKKKAPPKAPIKKSKAPLKSRKA